MGVFAHRLGQAGLDPGRNFDLRGVEAEHFFHGRKPAGDGFLLEVLGGDGFFLLTLLELC
jgi:hypothetical protein